ncbi:MAG: hypothetical protein IPH62_05925 [Ignavibacteriae bacterium]|nr:hypothetical protein [Ignavibacteriota bacterium]
MKTIKNAIVLSLILLFSINLNAQPTKSEKVKTVVANCYKSLTNDNEGVVESAIFVSIQFKNRFPEENDNIFVSALNDLAINSRNAIISYKAQLAKIYFENTELFKDIQIKSIYDDQKVYEQISDKLNSVVLASDF